MKKYVKPVLIFEQFELSKHIADCAWELNSSQDSCGAALDDEHKDSGLNASVVLFTNGNRNCIVDIKDFGVFCYHDGPDGMNVFDS